MAHRFEDARWPRASAWLAQGAGGGLGVLGVPLNASLTPGRCDRAPSTIRAALARYSPWEPESPSIGDLAVRDFGDLDVATKYPEEAFETIREAAREALPGQRALVLLGGDNGVTHPGVHALGRDLGRIGLITLDAHLDLRDTVNGLHNGNPVRALIEDGLLGANVLQIGIQAFANATAYAEVAREAGIQVVMAGQARKAGLARVVRAALDQLAAQCDAIYVDLDLDCLDRAHVPACPGARPGGFAPWEVREAARVCGMNPKVRIMDLVEMDPEKDVNDATALLAAACLLEFAAGVSERPH